MFNVVPVVVCCWCFCRGSTSWPPGRLWLPRCPFCSLVEQQKIVAGGCGGLATPAVNEIIVLFVFLTDVLKCEMSFVAPKCFSLRINVWRSCGSTIFTRTDSIQFSPKVRRGQERREEERRGERRRRRKQSRARWQKPVTWLCFCNRTA